MDIKNKFLVMLMLVTIVPRLSAEELCADRIHICIEKTKQLSTDCKKVLTDLFKDVRKRSARYTSQINPVVATGSASLVIAAGLAYRTSKARSDQRSPNPGPLLPEQREYPLEDGTMKTGEFSHPDGMPREGGLAVDYSEYEQNIVLTKEKGTKTKPRLLDAFTPPAGTTYETVEDGPGDLPAIEEDDVTHLKKDTLDLVGTVKRTLSRAASLIFPVDSQQT